jgi:prolyl-tRNA synthetase
MDGYSFHLDLEDAKREYYKMYDVYHRIFAKLGLVSIAVNADSGAIGGSLSHEFQVIAETGESQLYYDAAFDDIRAGKTKMSGDEMRKLYAAADELHVAEKCPVRKERLKTARGIEVGHIFLLGRKYTDAMGIDVTGPDGKEVRVEMATFGIGVSRLVGAIIQASHDEKGIIWPESVAPYQVGLINIRAGDEKCDAACDKLYAELEKAGISVLYDDRKESPGSKFATMDLIGLPWQVSIGPKSLEAGKAELKNRRTGEKSEVPLADVAKSVA